MASIRNKRDFTTALGRINMEMSDAKVKKQLEFVMKVGYQMKTFLNKCLIDAFKTHDDRSAAFYSTLINFVANTVSEVSEPENAANNIKDIIKGLEDWVEGKGIVMMKLDPITKKVNREDLH